jgi:S1-C subfamily serine protease
MLIILFVVFIVVFPSSTSGSSSVEEVRNSVVCIIVPDRTGMGASLGTGFGIGLAGQPVQYVVTNYHVVEGNEEQALVWLSGEQYVPAKPVYRSQTPDIAVLKLEKALTVRNPVKLRPSDGVSVAQKVFALGFPGVAFDLQDDKSSVSPKDVTVSTGIISRTTVIEGVSFYQIDVPINHGNSGGPLIAEDGAVIGINTLGYEGISGINAAIQIDELLPHLDQLHIAYELSGAAASSGNGETATAVQPAGGQSAESTGNSLAGSGLLPVVGALLLLAAILAIIAARRRPAASAPVAVSSGGAPLQSAGLQPARLQPSQPAGLSHSAGPVHPAIPPQPVPARWIKAALTGVAGCYAGTTIQIGRDSLVIGRNAHQCHLVFPQDTPGISGRHCEIRHDEVRNVGLLIDHGSTYGTFKSNGEKLVPGHPYELRSGDRFYLASDKTMFEYAVGG